MATKIQTHGKYYKMFPMTFYCGFCECIFDCNSINDIAIRTFLDEVFAYTNCPECEATVKNHIGSIEPEIEVDNYE